MINIREAKTNFLVLVDLAHNGEEIILSKAGHPYARLMPLDAIRKPGRVPEINTQNFFDPLPEDELTLWNPS